MTTTIARAAPGDAAECARLLADAARERRTVRVAGGMSKSYLGELHPTDIELRTSNLAGIVDHVPADLTVTVAAGTRLADLADALGRAGQFLPLDPPHATEATLGGVIAANSNGYWRSRYGAVRDLLIGTRIALVDGTVVRAGGRVVKNVAGYDLNKLLVGSLGTLGVIVEATLKVLPIPPASDGIIARFARPADAFAAAQATARAAARPEVCAVDRGEDGSWRVLVRARGDAAAVTRAIADARREAGSHGAAIDAIADELEELRELPARASEGALMRAALPLGALAPFADTATRLESLARIAADAASGVVYIHLEGDDDLVIRDADALLLATRAVGAAGRVERRAPSLGVRLPAWPAPPNGLELMRRVKEAFDPAGILEPGRSAIG